MGSVFAAGDPRGRRIPRSACSRSARSPRRATSSRSRRTRRSRRADLNFLGNTEARDLLRGAADVVVTDGFTGNVALKLLEGTISELLDELRDGDRLDRAGKARRPADPSGGPPAARPPRPGHLRRRLPARAAGPVGRRPRELLQPRDRERDPARGPRGRASGRRAAGRASARPCSIGALLAATDQERR